MKTEDLIHENERLSKLAEMQAKKLAELEGLVALQADAFEGAEEMLIAAYFSDHPKIIQLQDAISASAETVAAFKDKLTSCQCHPASCRDEMLWRKTLADATEPLRREVAMLSAELKALAEGMRKSGYTDTATAIEKLLSNTQATAQAYEQKMKREGAVEALEDARVDNGRGFSLWFSREEWGGIIDGLVLEIERSGGRKKTNSESTSDVRMTMCERIIASINNASELRATSKKAG